MRNNPIYILSVWRLFLLSAVSLFLFSCQIDKDLEECPYNARLEYWYTGTGQANVLPDYIFGMKEFVFDSLGVLRQVNELAGKKNIAAELNLPPGRYTLVAWGNLDSLNRLNESEIGRTILSDIRLYANHPVSSKSRADIPLRQGIGEPLYYGYASFTIQPQGVSRQRIDMVHAHLKLEVAVKWKGKAPTDTGDLYMSLSGIPSVYKFRPAYELKGSPYSTYSTEADGSFTRSGIWYYIPERPDDCPLVTHEVPVKMDITRMVNATFITYRLGSDDHPVLRLYGDGKPLIREIDLYKYFRTMQIDLDENLRQEFSLVVEVDAGGGILVSSAVVSDWVDGGSIGGML